jgi:hypothetical protein
MFQNKRAEQIFGLACRDMRDTYPGPSFCFRDEKQIDFAEQVESVAYVLCGEGAITLEKFYQIFQAKGVSY